MKRFISILMVAIMVIACASAVSAEEYHHDFEDESAGMFSMNGSQFPSIKEENGNHFINFGATIEECEANGVVYDTDEDGNKVYVSGGVDGMLNYTSPLVSTYGNEFILECQMRFHKFDNYVYEEGNKLFQIQPKAILDDGTQAWAGNVRPAMVIVNGDGVPALTGQGADHAYACKWDTWYDVALAFDFTEHVVTGYINGNKAYTANIMTDDKVVVDYAYCYWGVPDKVPFPFDVDMDDLYIFSGTKPKKDPTGDLDPEVDVPTGDVTAIVALVAVLACGTGIVASKKH